MTNYEKFKDVINKSNGEFGVFKGVAKDCHSKINELSCIECDFDMSKDCFPQRMKWCAEEYHEPEPEPEKEESEKPEDDSKVNILEVVIAKHLSKPLVVALTEMNNATAIYAMASITASIVRAMDLGLDNTIDKMKEFWNLFDEKEV